MPTQQSTALEVVTELPLSPILVIPSETLAVVEAFRHSATTIVVSTPGKAEEAGVMLRQIIETANILDARRKEVKAPFLEAERKIDGVCKAPAATLEAARNCLRGKLATWQTEQDRLAREAEQRRQDELARLVKEQREVEERARQAQAAASIGDSLDEFGADQVAAEVAGVEIAARQAQLAVAVAPAQRPAGITYRTTLKFEVTNVRQLPTHLLTTFPNEAAIRAQFCTGYKEGQPLPVQPGIRFFVDKLPVVSSRR